MTVTTISASDAPVINATRVSGWAVCCDVGCIGRLPHGRRPIAAAKPVNFRQNRKIIFCFSDILTGGDDA
jgi:hypothetical protein